MKVLLVKLSSMGDIVHTLPALTDAALSIPDIEFTWVIDAAFQEIAHWHPAVRVVMPIDLRKRNYKQILGVLRRMRLQKYDLIIDAQGLLKSALLTRVARGKLRVGYDQSSCREPIASKFYSRGYAVSRELHAVDRMRNLFANALGYPAPTKAADYGVSWSQIVAPQQIAQPYLVFLHGTTWDSKHWPEKYWLELADLVDRSGYKVQVTWATEDQKQRALRFSAYSKNITMLPHLTLTQALAVLYHASGAVAVDTGFAHLSAALSKPTVTIFGATDVRKCGTVGSNNINLVSKFACAPCSQRVCNLAKADNIYPPCYREITPQIVWQNLSGLLPNI